MPETTIPLTKWLDHLKNHIPIAQDGSDTEGVHQLRVATRRISAWLELGEIGVIRDDLRWLRNRASAVRDLDVLLEEIIPPEPLLTWLHEIHRSARRELLAALGHSRLHGLLAALDSLPPLTTERAQMGLPRIVRATLRRGEAVEHAPHELETMHRLRRGARRLRYCLEWLDISTKPLKAMQKILGEANDLAMTLRFIDMSPHSHSLVEYRCGVEEKLDTMASRSVDVWLASRDSIRTIA